MATTRANLSRRLRSAISSTGLHHHASATSARASGTVPSWDDQAHAYAYLLDHLGIEKVAVVAMSHGGPSALLFAVLHPERVSSLTLISCGVASSSAESQMQANEKGDMLTTIFKHDPLYWAISTLFKKQLMSLMGADDAVVASLTPEQRKMFEDFIDFMNPVSLRSAGAAFDNQATLPGERIAAITAPTLILHATDDTLQLYRNAEFAASTVPNAKLIRFEKGGHFLIGVEQSTIRETMADHILGHSSGPAALECEEYDGLFWLPIPGKILIGSGSRPHRYLHCENDL